jgi:CDP-L-myo-inositol myo-inositolphosphotransferase
MKCLIIAAGKGSRLSTTGPSKPLIPLLGLSFIERVILTAKKSGLNDFCVVTGHNGEKVKSALERIARTRRVNITTVANEQWQRENGLSVLKAKELLNGEHFILLMADHILEGDILSSLQKKQLQNGEVVLAVDYKTGSNGFVDTSDVTKVYVRNGKVMNIGKNLGEYNAYDTGVFLCSPAIFPAIEQSAERSDDASLSGGIKVLAGEGKVKTFDIGDGFWIDVDEEKTLRKAEKALMGGLIKPSDGPVSRYINRPISTRITKYLVRTNVTPNQISFFSFILASIASVLFLFSSYITLVAGGVLAQLSSVIDGCDGEVARLKHEESDFGKWFDAVLDRYADALMLFGLTYHSFAVSGSPFDLFIGFMAIIGSFITSYTADKYDGLMKEKFKSGGGFRIGRDLRVFLIFVGAVANQPLLTLFVIAVLMNIESVRRVFVCYSKQ